MSEPEEKEGPGFRIIDRRGSRGEPPEAPPPPSAPPPPPSAGPRPRGEAELPRIDFPTFVLSLFTSALYQMGLAPTPGSGEPPPEPDLLLARQTIDTLEMLEVKTRGNLDADEAHLLENALYELRMRFVEALKAHPPR
jgi:hypothetical protein